MQKLFTPALLLAAALFPTASAAETLTVCDGTATNDGAPVYAYWMDRANRSQMIYPASMLESLEGKTLTGVKFFVSSISKAWTNDEIKISLAEAPSDYFASAEYLELDGVTVSSEAVNLGTDAVEWSVTFASPYVYRGGNLLVDVANPAKGTSPRINWFGENQESVTALAKGNNIREVKFLPKMEIEYTTEDVGARATVSSKSLSFPLTFTDASAEKTVTVSNVGTELLTGTVAIEGSDAFSADVKNVEGLVPGESLEIAIVYAPQATAKADEATCTIDLGEGGKFEVALSGSALDVPTGYRELFDGGNYAEVLPADWTGWAEEIFVSDGSLSDATADYDYFPTTYRFSNYSFDSCSGIAWNHVNWAPSTDLYRQYYYLVSPELNGRVMMRAMMTDLPAAGCFVEVYPVVGYDDLNNRFTLAEEPVAVDWDSELSNTGWSVGTLNVDSPTRLAFFMKYAALDFVASDKTTGVCSAVVVPEDGALEVYDLSGRRVNAEAYSAGQVPSGVYILRQGADVKKVVRR